ncbi:MAG TPA: GNAT family N-acetyltransferase, partial [Kribbellaceae bacterium]
MPVLVPPVVPPGRMSGRLQPVLSVDELTLRPWGLSDVPCLVEAYRDEDIVRWHVRSMSDEDARGWITSWPGRWAAETGADWAVAS